jgi:hypothetical protein
MIDELEQVRRFRSDEPPPSAIARLHASSALTRAIEQSSTRSAQSPPSKREDRRRRRPPLRIAIIVPLVALCLLVAVLAGSGPEPGPSLAVAQALERLAQIAADGPSLVPGPGQYLYIESRNNYPTYADVGHQTCVTRATDHRQVWIAANGSGLLRDTTGPSVVTSASDRLICGALKPDGVSRSGTGTLWFAAGCFALGPGNDMQDLSTNPQTLLDQMRQIEGGPATPLEDFVHVGDFLRETDASPAVRAALYRAAALIPDVHLLGTVHDHLGRAGLGLAYEARGVRHELIFDPRTSSLLGEQDVGSSPGGPTWAVYLQSRLVDDLPLQPPIPLQPACTAGGGYITHTSRGDVQTGRPPTP